MIERIIRWSVSNRVLVILLSMSGVLFEEVQTRVRLGAASPTHFEVLEGLVEARTGHYEDALAAATAGMAGSPNNAVTSLTISGSSTVTSLSRSSCDAVIIASS